MEIKWIKIATGMFDDEAIQIMLSMPEGSTLLEIWLRLLIAAGKTNDNGLIYVKKQIPYTEDMLAMVFRKDTSMIKYALSTFKKFGMIEVLTNNQILITNWEKHQNIDGMERIKELTKNRVRKHREKQKALLLENKNGCNVTCNVSETVSNSLDIEEEIDIEKEIENTCQKPVFDTDKFVELYNSKCSNLPKIVKLTDDRRRKIKTRLNSYPNPEWWATVFDKANKSDFCVSGKWCNIDWFISNDTNSLKVYEGKYDNKGDSNNATYNTNAKTDRFDRQNGWF